MEDVIIDPQGTIAYLPKTKMAVTTGTGATVKQRPTSPVEKLNDVTTKYARWGDDNLFPQTVLKEIEGNTIIGSTLNWKARALYSGGVMYGQMSYDDQGNEKFKAFMDPEIEEFKRRSNVTRYLIEACMDLYYFYNIFPEVILSEDRSKVASVSIQEAMFCRWERQDPKTGIIKNCYINANWEESGVAFDQNVVPVIDPYFAAVENVRDDTSSRKKYIYPVSYPTPGKVYYQLAHWDSIRVSKWLNVARLMPEFKTALFENQILTQYHVEISTAYWPWKYKNWESLPIDKKVELMKEELKSFDERMAGLANAGKSIMTSFEYDSVRGQENHYWKITAIDNKIKSGIYVEDSQEASSHLLYALEVDPTIIGSAPGKGMGSGSGSDKREAFNMYISLCEIHAHLILEPLQFIADYNGWSTKYPGFTWRFRRPILQTLNEVTPGKRATVTPTPNGTDNKN